MPSQPRANGRMSIMHCAAAYRSTQMHMLDAYAQTSPIGNCPRLAWGMHSPLPLRNQVCTLAEKLMRRTSAKIGGCVTFWRVAAVAAALAWTDPSVATAQDWPTRPVRIYVGFGAGGGTDIVARVVADRLSVVLGQQFVV